MNQNKDLIAAVSRLSRMLRRHPIERDSLGHMSFHILRAVQEHDGIRAAELARLMEVRPASITEALNRLERDGYVLRKKDAVDSRVKRVFLTDKACTQFQKRARDQEAKNQLLLTSLTEEEADTFLTVCSKLCQVLEQEFPQPPCREYDHPHHDSNHDDIDHKDPH